MGIFRPQVLDVIAAAELGMRLFEGPDRDP